jgi:pyruvate dehydrogenase E2 component (dihydrolipoamide acetyltransferase)
VESCVITGWMKKAGDQVHVGDVLFSYETDKASFEEEAGTDGILLAVFFQEGDDVPCLTNVAVIGAEGESVEEFRPGSASEAPGPAKPEGPGMPEAPIGAPPAIPAGAPAEMPVGGLPEATPAGSGFASGITGISPRARSAAARLKVDAGLAAPTGPKGRIIERDVIELARSGRTGSGIGGRNTAPGQAADQILPTAGAQKTDTAAPSAPEPSASGYRDEKLSNLRKIIGRNMHESLLNLAQLTHNTSFDATAILDLRERLKAAPEWMDLPRISINDMILFAVSRSLPAYPDLNAHYLDDKIRYFDHVNIGIAVDTPRGLLVPTLFAADTKSLSQIAREAGTLARAAQDGSIHPDYLSGATFTVSNLGAFGIESFTPVINPPQTGLLGVNCITERIRTVGGVITAYPAMGLSLTYDHRAVDGAPASRYLQHLVRVLENFSLLLAG